MSKYTSDSLFETADEKQIVCNHIIRVAFEAAVDTSFDYAVPDEIWPIKLGQRVQVPFGSGNRPKVGYCVVADIEQDQSFAGRKTGRRLKKVIKVIDKAPLLDEQLMDLAGWISDYYVCPLGQVLAAMLPMAVKKAVGVKTEKFVYLSQDCQEAVEQLKGKKQKQVVSILQQKKALDSQTAVELQTLLAQAGCTVMPVKKLAEKQIIKITATAVLKSLPAIPERFVIKSEKVVLNDDQKKALDNINEQVDTCRFGVTVLFGVTDSGKTELYIKAIETAIKNGKSAIVLLPEIALTTQTVQRFSARFEKIAVMHSRLKASARNAQWQKIKAGQADVIIGARSAVFAPVKNLGLIIVDEEHEPSYKQDTAPRYNGRDVAIKRAQLTRAHCILGSATPSLESLHNCRTKKHFNLIQLPKRVMNLPMPTMKLIDMRYASFQKGRVSLISDQLHKHLTDILSRDEQAILLLNRRGYSNFVFCPSCKHSLHCRNCDVTLTFHKAKLPHRSLAGAAVPVTGRHISTGYAICHYCLAQTLVPEKCPVCSKKMIMIGLGSQRLEEELLRKFPAAKVARVDSDSMQSRDYYSVLGDFSKNRINILVGTQMLAKGLHFPNVTLVGIISADTSLLLPDFRANERTFQLICQVAGRAGRSQKKGYVFIQTFLPDQAAIQFAVKHDYKRFTEEELKHRQKCNLPPYWRLALIEARDPKFDRLTAASDCLRGRIDYIIQRQQLTATVRGPIQPAISRIQRHHRMQIIVQAPNAQTIQQLFAALRAGGPSRPKVRVAIDIDPANVL